MGRVTSAENLCVRLSAKMHQQPFFPQFHLLLYRVIVFRLEDAIMAFKLKTSKSLLYALFRDITRASTEVKAGGYLCQM